MPSVLDGHLLQVRVRRGIGQLDRLFHRDTDLALQQNLVLLKCVLRGDDLLLLRLILHARSQLIQPGRSPGFVLRRCLLQQELVGAQ